MQLEAIEETLLVRQLKYILCFCRPQQHDLGVMVWSYAKESTQPAFNNSLASGQYAEKAAVTIQGLLTACMHGFSLKI